MSVVGIRFAQQLDGIAWQRGERDQRRMLTDPEERSYLDGEHSVAIRRRLISISCCRQVYERAVERFVEHDHE